MRPEADPDLDHLNRTYRPALMAFFLRRLRNHAEAEDMTQDVFVRLAKAEKSPVQSEAAYIFQVAGNLLKDRARREKRRFDFRGALAAEDNLGVDLLDPARIVSGQQSLSALTAALKDLPELTRAVFVLHRLEAVGRRAIADSYGISEQAVDRHLSKAMAFLIARVREVPL